jgi:hypothetical protein
MTKKRRLAMSLLFAGGAIVAEAQAQNLIVIRSRSDIAARRFDPVINDRIARDRLVFHGDDARIRADRAPYQIAVFYPAAAVPPPQEQGFSGADERGNLYFKGYRVTPSGWISARVNPTDATLLVDGRPLTIDRNSGLSETIGILVGRHRVEARRDGFKPYVGDIEVRQAGQVQLDIKLIK